MWIVRLALKRPYTFVVMSILIVIMGTLAIFRTPTDIFPNINIPVVSIIWNYNGLVPEDMADRIVASRSGRRSEEHTSELQSRPHLVCRLLLEKKKHTVDLHRAN